MAELAISNIAWTNDEEPAVIELLKDLGVSRVELAPTKYWDDPTTATEEQINEHLRQWRESGIEVVAFQSMLFSRPDLKLFETDDLREELIEYMSDFLRLASDMGASRLVFGSPKNRQKGGLDNKEAFDIAVDIFSRLGEVATKNDTILCIEPNAVQYGCDFITNAKEGGDIVRRIGSGGVGLHLDTACMYLAGDNIAEAIHDNADILKHFHVSAPMLGAVGSNSGINYQEAATALRDIGYDGVVSIEMRPGEPGTNVERVKSTIEFARSVFNLN